ncbi:hemagglutinin repeat-containing protein, partial [Fusobacterium sp.]|uniref:hemagglutinin repeat-containing protein n=1 Tax=Fusobacterium sp. TaxID=68766 RepID=UPI002A829343
KIGSDKVLKIEQNKNTKELLKMPKIAKKLLSGKDLNEALAGNEGAIEEANLIANGPKSGNAETGLYLSGSLTKTKQSTKIINSIGSNLIAKNNITLKSGDDINLTMVNIISKNIFIDALKNINIYAGKSTVESRESTKSLSGSYNLLTDQFSIGAGVTKDELEAESYSNSKIIGENINIKGKDLTIKGANIIGNDVNINVANLHLESLQDKLKSTHKGFNTSGGNLSLGMGKEYSAGLGMEYGNRDKAWVSEQSSIIGKNSANINVDGKTKLVGSVIGGGKTTLRTGKLEYSDIYDKDKGYDIGLNTNASFSLKRMRDNITQTTYEKLLIDKTGELNYGATDREQINRATIGNGTIIVGGKIVNPDINRDESKAQEITKNINVNKISLQYTDNRRDWSLGSVQDILGEYFKNTVIEPIEGLNQKLKLYEKYDFFKSNTPRYKYVVEKDLNGNIIGHDPVRLADDAIFDKGSVAHINGMDTDLSYALKEVKRQHLMKSLDDSKLSVLKNGEKREFIIFQNETHGNWSDLVECAYDKFGIKGRRKIYSNAAKEVGETIYLNRDRIDDFTMFSQGNIQWRAGLEYMEEKYGEGVLKEITTKRYHSIGSPYNAKDLITFLRNKEMIKNPDYTNVEIKNDNLDIVANAVGFNGMSIVSRDEELQDKIDKKIKYGIWDPHSAYTAGTKPTSKIKYRGWQLPLIGIDKILRLFNPKEYFDKEKYNPTINKGADENDKK